MKNDEERAAALAKASAVIAGEPADMRKLIALTAMR